MIRDHSFTELSAGEFHDLIRLRVDVFVVEQDCPYPELDGRDTEPTTRHVWLDDELGPTTYVRLLDEGSARRIGRVVTRVDARGRGLAATLIGHVLATSSGPWVLHAQSQLRAWYETLGFAVTGPEFDEDGIAHLPMRREV